MMRNMKLRIVAIFALLLIAVCAAGNNNKDANGSNASNDTADGVPAIIPVSELDPDSPMTEAIQYGEEIFNETNTVLADYAANELSCQSCHADGGLSKVLH